MRRTGWTWGHADARQKYCHICACMRAQARAHTHTHTHTHTRAHALARTCRKRPSRAGHCDTPFSRAATSSAPVGSICMAGKMGLLSCRGRWDRCHCDAHSTHTYNHAHRSGSFPQRHGRGIARYTRAPTYARKAGRGPAPTPLKEESRSQSLNPTLFVNCLALLWQGTRTALPLSMPACWAHCQGVTR